MFCTCLCGEGTLSPQYLERKMRMRKKRVKDVLKVIAVIVCIPLIYQVAVISFPYVKPLFEKAAVVSAGITFFEGGEAIVDDDSDEIESGIVLNDVDEFEYEEETQEYIAPATNPTSSQAESAVTIQKPAGAGTILRKTYSEGNTKVYVPLKDGFIKNCTSVSADKILKAVSQKPKFKIKADGSPEVLIYHTHATESFQDEPRDWFSKSFPTRTTDNNKNVTRVGDEIEKQLKAAGIGVIHDKTPHDYPSYNGAYERSSVTIKKILKENPTIKVALDIHRDAIQPDDNTMVSPVTTINGRSCAQVMIISGCDNGKMNMPKYMENLKFSASLQNTMEKSYKTLTRPILFDYRKYNQDLTTGSILIEVGGHANTLDEAIYSGELVGKSLVETLLALK